MYRIKKGANTSWRTTKHVFRNHRRQVVGDFLLATCQWTCRYAVLPILIFMFGDYVNPIPLFPLQGLLFLVSLMLILPGGGGGLEMLSVLVLPAFVPVKYVGVVLIIWRFFTYYIHLLVGGLVFGSTLYRMKGKNEKTYHSIIDGQIARPVDNTAK